MDNDDGSESSTAVVEDLSLDHEDDFLYRSTLEPSANIWNRLNAALFFTLMLSSLATAVPVTLVASMSQAFLVSSDETNRHAATASSFAPRAAAAAVLGTSLGKFVNGPVMDLWGARRTSVLYSLLLALALLLCAVAPSADLALAACFLVEFFASVQWPCCIVTLATHYRGNAMGMYEGGIYVTSLATRTGSLVGIPCLSLLLYHHYLHWRMVAVLGAWCALLASSVTYLYVVDSPERQNDPQNPLDLTQLQKWFPSYFSTTSTNHHHHYPQPKDTSWREMTAKLPPLSLSLRIIYTVCRTNIYPSLRHILQSGTFWIVALAHTGASMVRTSERVLGTYLFETSSSSSLTSSFSPSGKLAPDRASGLAVFQAVGMVAGLVIAGSLFASRPERPRKWLVSRLYVLTIASCYVLALLAIPSVRQGISYVVPDGTILAMQVLAIASCGFGIAVQFYHIPGLVGATFGCDKGLFLSYCDGVAYGIASMVWKIIGHVLALNNDDQYGTTGGNGMGWAYAWAAVALILIPSAILMVEFMEHYFCRPYHGGTYETILFA